ncbi:hypothetical protein HM1_0156 [Heliomicrobium modesticaldum Ice1]|uniref:Uncharacterized protein n=1 Tax=Heliobacterium modesticaldum (strain ATCC 51547 / Ice1) TaxID=498761 RepID=B0TDR2_HELMI|nr:hypothetical protein HM1_0156 [Heliomicrobium modesticaldum Ice1]
MKDYIASFSELSYFDSVMKEQYSILVMNALNPIKGLAY